eukprot:TRINITY_DN71_c0_g1_i1.p1 TRINITY_DN71_c0_g1~~TRINITY_DN71_c0_g1_i1.p1  ORF type:complete len:375 (+),score=38.33 TRINITY_DN71_c0_g1_i1:174-1298(+)
MERGRDYGRERAPLFSDRVREKRYAAERERDRERDRERGISRYEYRDRDRDRDRERAREAFREVQERDSREPHTEEVAAGRALFVGSIDNYVTCHELEDLFNRKGKVTRVDLKQGYAFIFMESGHKECIREFDNYPFFDRRLKVELARGDGVIKRREDERRREASERPSDTLFVVNFDHERTHPREIERVFQPYGEVTRVELKRNFAFVQFAKVEDAKRALDNLNGYKLNDRVISVEFTHRTIDERDRKRGRSPSPRRREYSPPLSRRRMHSRSPSPRGNRRFDESRDRDRNGRDSDRDRERNRDGNRDRDGDRDEGRDGDRDQDRDGVYDRRAPDVQRSGSAETRGERSSSQEGTASAAASLSDEERNEVSSS